MRFSYHEKKDLVFAGFMISLAFAVLFSGGLMGLTGIGTGFIIVFVIAFFTGGIGFLLHELMHKFVAQSYGIRAEFRAFRGMLWLALAFSFFGFIFAAPGAVFMSGFISREKNGKISFAGPATNLVLAVLFFIPFLLLDASGFLHSFLNLGFIINSLLAAFNMIPTMPFDGAKVWKWNKGVYWVTTALAVGLFILSFVV